MKCEIIQDLIPTYCEGVCSEETKILVEAHIQECAACRQEIEAYQEIETMDLPTIDEKKPFKKIIKGYQKKLFLICLAFLMIFLLFGTRITSELMKLRFLSYVTRHYAQYDLEMTSFSYEDPQVSGFGINNGYYVASFQSKNKQEKDIAFQVYTDGFIFSIKDTYEHQINQKWNTCDRLVNVYGEDIKKALLQQEKFTLLDASASLACTDGYFDKNLAKHLKVNQPYNKTIDTFLPIRITLTIHATDNDITNIQEYTKSIVDTLYQLGFSPLRLSLRLETAKQSYQIDNIDCTKDIYAQKLVLE